MRYQRLFNTKSSRTVHLQYRMHSDRTLAGRNLAGCCKLRTTRPWRTPLLNSPAKTTRLSIKIVGAGSLTSLRPLLVHTLLAFSWGSRVQSGVGSPMTTGLVAISANPRGTLFTSLTLANCLVEAPGSTVCAQAIFKQCEDDVAPICMDYDLLGLGFRNRESLRFSSSS